MPEAPAPAPAPAPRRSPATPPSSDLPDLAVSPQAAERLRVLLRRELGIEATPEEALRAGTFLLNAAVLLAPMRGWAASREL